MKTSLVRSLQVVAGLGLATVTSQAAPQTFDFKDPKGVNHVQFKLDAPLESITGTGTGVSGSVAVDPANPTTTRGRIVLDAASLTVGNPLMGEHLRSDQWLDVAQYPEIVFEAVGLENVRAQGTQLTADVQGKLTVKGVTKVIRVPVSFTHLADKLGARVGDPKVKGDLLVLRANFAINRGDFDIKPGELTDKVAEIIHLSLSIAGSAPRS